MSVVGRERSTSPRVLMLVGHESDADALAAAARAQGLGLSLSDDSTELLIAFREERPEGVVLTLGEHEEEAILLCRALRKRITGDEIPIILVSGEGTLVESREEALDAGADELIDALEPAGLMQRVRALVVLPEVTVMQETPASAGSPAGSGPPLLAEGHAPGEARWTPGASAGTALQPATAFAHELELMLDAVRHTDYFAMLGLQREATPTEIQGAYLAATRRYSVAHARSPYEHHMLAEISEGLADAWQVLGDGRLRRLYREHLPRR